MAKRLEGKTAIITGAAGGIGRAAARLFAAEGARILIADFDAAGLEQTVALLKEDGHSVLSATADVGREEEVRSLVERAQKDLGGLSAFFANAGVTGKTRTIADTSVEQFQEVLRINLIGPFLAIKLAAPVMAQAGKGSIVCTASVAGLRAGAGPVAYSASKAGVINLVCSSAQDLRGTHVRVNAICPGLIETNMTKPMFEYAKQRGSEHKLGQFTPLERAGQPAEIAQAAVFLASDESSYVNGHALVVDGGLTSSVPFQPPRK
ncbi:MAG TPA: SDR family NAD(P)-dependent oxidoreductase [Polyangiales bacterium]